MTLCEHYLFKCYVIKSSPSFYRFSSHTTRNCIGSGFVKMFATVVENSKDQGISMYCFLEFFFFLEWKGRSTMNRLISLQLSVSVNVNDKDRDNCYCYVWKVKMIQVQLQA